MTDEMKNGRRQSVRTLAPLLVGLAHFAVAFGSLALTRWSNGLASIWLPNAIFLAYLLVSPRTRWPTAGAVVLISGTVANWLGGAPVFLSLLFGGTNVFEPIIVAVLLQAARRTVDLEQLAHLLRFVLASAMASLLSATIAATAMAWAQHAPFGEALQSWFVSSFLGMVIATPILLIGHAGLSAGRLHRRQIVEGTIALALVGVSGAAVFLQGDWPLFFLLQPPVLLATFRMRSMGAAAATLILAAIGTVAVITGTGPTALVEGSFGERMAILQGFLGVTILTAMPIAAALAQRDRFARNLADGEERFRAVVSAVTDVIFRTDVNGRWTYLNPAWEQLTGFPVQDAIGESFLKHVVEPDRGEFVARMAGFDTGYIDAIRHQFRFRNAFGEERWAEVQSNRLENERGEMIGAAGIIVDISDRLALSALADDARRRAEREAEAALLLAATDELTGIASRRAFLAMLEQRLDEGGALAVALFDIDHFKLVNDRYGHGVGDEVLARVAGIADGCVRGGDLAGRLGGEEFAVLMTGATLDQAVAMGERLRRACAETVHPPGLSVTVSVGVAAARPGSTSASLLREADDALYRAKFEGRNCLRRAA